MNYHPGMNDEGAELARRLQQAVRNEPVPAFLEQRVRARISAEGNARRAGWPRWSFAAAALAAVLTVGVSYELGHLRITDASKESYTVGMTQQVATILRAGLGDHIHCAYFRKFPNDPPPAAEFIRKLGPSYAALLPAVSRHAPAGTRVEEAHICKHKGRKFVHLTMRGDSRLLSLVITRKRAGESFQIEGLLPSLAQQGLPIYRATAQKFQVASFETGEHLVYFVSDLGADANQETLLAMAPEVREVLSRAGEI